MGNFFLPLKGLAFGRSNTNHEMKFFLLPGKSSHIYIWLLPHISSPPPPPKKKPKKLRIQGYWTKAFCIFKATITVLLWCSTMHGETVHSYTQGTEKVHLLNEAGLLNQGSFQIRNLFSLMKRKGESIY